MGILYYFSNSPCNTVTAPLVLSSLAVPGSREAFPGPRNILFVSTCDCRRDGVPQARELFFRALCSPNAVFIHVPKAELMSHNPAFRILTEGWSRSFSLVRI
jgi:hypothetical protein